MVRAINVGPKDQDIQSKAVEMEMLRQEMQRIDQQLVILETRKLQISNIKKGLSKIQGEEEILIPLGPGFLTKGKLSKDRNIIMEVGANMAVEKTIEESEKLIDKNLEELEKIENKLKVALFEMSKKMQEYQDILLQYYG